MSANVWSEARFRALIVELADENPFAIRAVLQVLGTEFTSRVPTLAVTCEARPRLCVNLAFINAHCRNDTEVKALICHEFLHVLLRHTASSAPVTPARHLATDAVINAIIHRQQGTDMSALFSRYYADVRDLRKMLRPMTEAEQDMLHPPHRVRHPWPAWVRAWDALYQGQLVADDIDGLAEDLSSRPPESAPGFPLDSALPTALDDLLGDHGDWKSLPEVLRQALDRTLREMNGHGIWRNPWRSGVAANPYAPLLRAAEDPVRRWERSTLDVLRRHLQPDPTSPREPTGERRYVLPVLSPSDRRACLSVLWSPFLPDAAWMGQEIRPAGRAQVYLDVSGSMHAEMPLVIALLGRLGRYIRRPFWAFSDRVEPAEIRNGRLLTRTTGGTAMNCVLEHLARTSPPAAVVVTDGFIEPLRPELLNAVARIRLHVVLTREGNAAPFDKVGLPYTRLEEYPA